MRKTKVILFTIFGTTVGLVASVFALVVKSVTIDILKGYSLEWIVDVIINIRDSDIPIHTKEIQIQK